MHKVLNCFMNSEMSFLYRIRKVSGFWPGCFVLLLLCCYGRVSAQYQIPFINYTMKNGLVQNQVQDICQDRKGYIWIATVGGVSRFDGKNFTNFTVSNGLPVNTVTELLVDSRNRVWMTTIGGGITVYDGKSFRTYTTDDGLASNTFFSDGLNKMLLEDSQGNIWCRTNNEGISVIGASGVMTYNKNNGLAAEQVYCFKEDARGRVLCATETGLFVIDGGKIMHHIFENIDFQDISSIVMDQNGEIWIFGKQPAQFVDDQLLVRHVFSHSGKSNMSGFVFHDRLWIAIVNELYIFDEGKFTQVRKPDESIKKFY